MKNIRATFIAIAVLAGFAASSPATADTQTWNGTGTDWNTTGDWNTAIPGPADTALFNATGNANLVLTLSAAGTAQSIQFGSGDAYTIGTTTGPALTLSDGGTLGSTAGVTGTIQTIDAPLVIGDTAGTTYNFSNSLVHANNFVFNGTIDGAAGTGNTTTLHFNQITATINGVIGDGSGGGTLGLSFGQTQNDVTLTAAETYTGTTNLSNNSTVTMTGSFGNTAITVGTQGTLNLNAAGAVSQNSLNVNGGTLTENVANAITGTASFQVQGSGQATFNDAQNYTGTTTVSGGNNGGTLTISGAGSLGNTAITIFTGGTLNLETTGAVSQNTIAVSGGVLNASATDAITNGVGIRMTGGNAQVNITAAQNYTGATYIGDYGGVMTISGAGALGNTVITVGNQSTLNVEASNAINLNNGSDALNTINVNTGGAMNVSAVDGITGLTGINANQGLVTVTAAQNYTGATVIGGGYFNFSDVPPSLPNPDFIISGAGALGNTAVTVDQSLSGFSGYLELNAAGAISQNKLTINSGIVTQGVAGAITGTTTVYINQSNGGPYGNHGYADFGDGNTYTGTTRLDGTNANVTLNITQLANGGLASSIGASSSAASNLIFSGGTLQATNLTSAQSTDRLFTLGDSVANGNIPTSASAIIDSSSANPDYTLSFTNTGAIVGGLVTGQYTPVPGLVLTGSNTGANVFAPLLSDLFDPNNTNQGSTMTKAGAGNWILTNANTFSGKTTILGGTLELGNANALQSSAVTLDSDNGLTFSAPGTYSIKGLMGKVTNDFGNNGLVSTILNIHDQPTLDAFVTGNEDLAAGITLQISSINFNNNNPGNQTYAYDGILSGAGALAMKSLSTGNFNNNGIQVFTASNTYSGGTTLLHGTLQTTLVANGTPFGTGSVALNGGVLNLSPGGTGSAIVYTMASDSGAQLTYGGGGELNLNPGTNTSLTVTVGSGAGTVLARDGNGTLIITTASGGGVGVLSLGSTDFLELNGTIPTVGNGGIVNGMVSASMVGSNLSSNGNINVTSSTASSTVTSAATSLGTFGVGSSLLGQTVTAVSGTPGNYTFTLSGNANNNITNDNTGYNTNQAGTFLTYDPTNGFVSAASSYVPVSGTIAAGGLTPTQISNFTAGTTITGDNTTYALLVEGTQVNLNSGVTLNVGDNTAGHQAGIIFNNGTQINGGTLNFGASEGVIYGFNEGASYAQGSISSVVTGTGGITFSGTSGNGSFSYLQLSNQNNTFSGGITVNEGAVLDYYGGSGHQTQFSNGTLGDPNNVITLNGGSIDSNGAFSSGSMVGLGRSIVLTAEGGTLLNANNYVANISGTGPLSIGYYSPFVPSPSEYGNGFVVLSGNNTQTGGLNLFSGFVEVSSEANLGSADGTITFAGGDLGIMGNSIHDFGSHTVDFEANMNAGFDIQNVNNTFTVTQAINILNGTLSKTGQGTLLLQAASNYSGQTRVYAGTLEVDASNGGSLQPSTSLFLDGGTFYLLGNSAGTVQSVNGLSMGLVNDTTDATSGGGKIIVNSNGGNTTLNLGTIDSKLTGINPSDNTTPAANTNNGSSLDIVAQGAGATVTTTSLYDASTGFSGESNGIYGGRIVYTDSTGATNWATSGVSSGGPGTVYTLTGYSDYEPYLLSSTDTDNVLITSSGTTNATALKQGIVNSLKIANTASGGIFNITNPAGFTITSGGLLFTGTADYTISGGTIYSGLVGSRMVTDGNHTAPNPSKDLIIQQYGTGNLIVSATIGNADPSTMTTLTKDGPGTLILSGQNTYLGQTFVNGGTLQISSNANISGYAGTILVDSATSGNNTVIVDSLPAGFGVGSLLLGRIVDSISGTTVTLNGGANTTVTSATTASWATGNRSMTLNGGTLQVTQSINFTLSDNTGAVGGTATYNRSLYLGAQGGTLDVLNGSVLTLPTVNSYVGGGNSGVGSLTINSSDDSGGVVFLEDQGQTSFYGGITLDGGVLRLGGNGDTGNTSVLGAGVGNYLSWSDTSDGVLQLNGYSALVAGMSSLSAAAVIENGNNSNHNAMIGVANGDDETFAGTLIDRPVGDTGTGTLGFLKAGTGTLSLTNTGSSYTGKTELDGGLVNVANLADGGQDSSLGAATNAAGNWAFGGGGVQYTGSTAQSTDRLFTLGDAGNALTSSVTQVVAGNNGTIDASGSTADATVTFSNTGAVAFANMGAHNLTLTGTNTGANTFNPLIGDSTFNSTAYATSLNKTGTGAWAITAQNTYSGGTTISGGQLYVNNANNLGSGTGSGQVHATDTGTLSGTGTIMPVTGPAPGVLVDAGGTIAPGGIQPAPGPTVVANGNLTLDPTNNPSGTILSATSANLTFALGAGGTPTGENDSGSKIVIGGSAANIVAFGGTAGNSVVAINDLVGGSLNLYQEYILIQGNGATTYTGLTLGDTIAGYGQLITGGLSLLDDPGNFFSSYYGGSLLFLNGQNIDVEVVPEPSTWALMIGGLVLLVYIQRRRRKAV